MYRWVVFLHILSAFLFVLMHGASAIVSLRLRKERDLDRVRALLDLSTAYLGGTYGALLMLLGAGVVAGFLGKWWGQGWIWVSLGVLIALMAAMYVLAHPSTPGSARRRVRSTWKTTNPIRLSPRPRRSSMSS